MGLFTTLKNNRLVRRNTASGYQGLDTREPPPRGWVSLRQHARRMGQTIYQAHQQQWAPDLRQLLQKPIIQAFV